MIYDRPQSLPAWAEDGSKVQPSNEQIQAGWPQSNLPPSRQRFNWVLNYVAQAVRYAMQTGIPEWSMDEDYPVNARVQHMGNTWVSLQPNTEIEPGTDFAYWERWGYRASENGGGGGGGSGTAEIRKEDFIATAGQTTFIIPGGYIVGSVQFVFVNGLSVGFTATNGGSVVLDVPATAGDLVEVYLFSVFVVEGTVRFGDPVLIDKGDLPFNADWNTYTTAGVYRITSGGGSGTNSPEPAPTQTGQLIVSTNGAAVTQLYFASDATGHFVRSKYTGSAWAEWQQVLTSENYTEFPAAVGPDSLETFNYKDKSVTLPKIQDIPSGVFIARLSLNNGVPELLNVSQASVLFTSKIQPIGASVNLNALTLTLNPTTLDFRSPTLGSGVVNTRRVINALSLVVPNGATLGALSGQPARFAVLAIDNAGTIELAVINLAGAASLDESGLVSTTAISAAADSRSVIYSSNARTAVPYRIVGYIDSTQTTAGTYTTAPSLIQGAGGNALQHIGAIVSTAAVTLAGTAVDITGIPVWAKRVTINFNGMSLSGTANALVQLGSGAVQSTGYSSGSSAISVNTPNSSSGSSSTSGFNIHIIEPAYVISGTMTIDLVSGTTWISSHSLAGNTHDARLGGGNVTLSGVLDRLRITTTTGTDTFDSGSFNIFFE